MSRWRPGAGRKAPRRRRHTPEGSRFLRRPRPTSTVPENRRAMGSELALMEQPERRRRRRQGIESARYQRRAVARYWAVVRARQAAEDAGG